MMTENVIERFIDGLEEEANKPNYFSREQRELLENVCAHARATTRPEQFMPPLKDWPEYADALVMVCAYPCGSIFQFIGLGRTILGDVHIYIPHGIDPRIEVSRAQMEEWEAEQQ